MKPATKETAILMLVDSIEAASRTIDPPEREAFETMIQRIIFTKLRSGQLDDSGLTVEDLRTLVNRMTDTLVNMHHHRVKYQWQAKKAEEFGVPSQTFARPSSPEIEVHQSLFPIQSSVPPPSAPGEPSAEPGDAEPVTRPNPDGPATPRVSTPPAAVSGDSPDPSPEPVRTSATVPIEAPAAAAQTSDDVDPKSSDLPSVESPDRPAD
jgi:hypothetical protein